MKRDGKGQRQRFRFLGMAVTLMTALAMTLAAPLPADNGAVAETVHNLSISGPGDIRSFSETEICKFCHIPHDAVVEEPLWGHALSQVRRYNTATLRRGRDDARPAPQPDGSSRLCLSCHDGTVALGEIAGEPRTLQMVGASRLGPGRRGYLGTDLSGSHPISFVVQASERTATLDDGERDMAVKPLGTIAGDRHVRLDANGKMQCTTCHDPHDDSNYQPGLVPRFWVKPTVGEVCLTCHDLR